MFGAARPDFSWTLSCSICLLTYSLEMRNSLVGRNGVGANHNHKEDTWTFILSVLYASSNFHSSYTKNDSQASLLLLTLPLLHAPPPK